MSSAKPSAPRRSRAEAAAETRERLLLAAREVFVRRGYQAASIYEIAEEAGRTIGALYGHFDGKEGIFLALVDRHFDEQLALVGRDLAGSDDPLAAGGEFWSRFLARDPELVVLFVEFWSAAIRDPALRRRFATSLRRLRHAWAQLIDEQLERFGAQSSVSSTEAAIVFDALVDGFALHKLADPRGVSDELLTRSLRWLAAGMFTAPGAERGR